MFVYRYAHSIPSIVRHSSLVFGIRQSACCSMIASLLSFSVCSISIAAVEVEDVHWNKLRFAWSFEKLQGLLLLQSYALLSSLSYSLSSSWQTDGRELIFVRARSGVGMYNCYHSVLLAICMLIHSYISSYMLCRRHVFISLYIHMYMFHSYISSYTLALGVAQLCFKV